jgi:hypothetical protein
LANFKSSYSSTIYFFFENYKTTPNTFPLFIHLLRIFSSKQSFSFISNSQNSQNSQNWFALSNLSKQLGDCILSQSDLNNCSLDCIGLLILDPPFRVKENINLLHIFFDNLFGNQLPIHNSTLNEISLQYFNTHISEIVNSILDQTIFHYFNIKISDSNISQFISDPNQRLYNIVYQNLENKKQNIISQLQIFNHSVFPLLTQVQNIFPKLQNSIEFDINFTTHQIKEHKLSKIFYKHD